MGTRNYMRRERTTILLSLRDGLIRALFSSAKSIRDEYTRAIAAEDKGVEKIAQRQRKGLGAEIYFCTKGV